MAVYYAEIVEGIVQQVLVTDGSLTHEETLQWLESNVSRNLWLKTDINGSIRNKYASVGDEYHDDIDSFVNKKPFNSWALDKVNKKYKAPKEYPLDGSENPDEGKVYLWDENSLSWVEG